MFVIYKPSVSITISSSTWEESVKDSLTYATDSIWLFGMHFDASKAVTTVNVQNDTHTIKFDNLSGGVAQPLVLGVLSDSYLHVGPPKLHANALLGEAPKRGKLPSGYWPA